MMHTLINPNGNYEPSSSNKKRWLFTRKKELDFDDLRLPGFYQTENFKIDRFLFFVVVILELYGTYILWHILPVHWFAFIGFMADLFCAVFSHLMKKRLCIAMNKKILAEHGKSYTENKSAKYEEDLQRGIIIRIRIWEMFWYTIIAMLALAKVLSILSYASGLVLAFKVLLSLIYISIAYIHIFHTGYFIAGCWFKYWTGKEKKDVKYNKKENFIDHEINNGILYHRRYFLNKHYKNTSVNKQIIKIDSKSNKTIFENWGVLQDDELIDLVKDQIMELQQPLAIELLIIQLDMLKREACRNESDIVDLSDTEPK